MMRSIGKTERTVMFDDHKLKTAQEAAEHAEERMLDMLMGYEPAQHLTVGNVKEIAGYVRRLAFDATEEFRS